MELKIKNDTDKIILMMLLVISETSDYTVVLRIGYLVYNMNVELSCSHTQ